MNPPAEPSRPPMRGGGCLVALGLVGGAAIGAPFHQSSIGLLAGFGLGVLAAAALWWRERS